METTIYCNCLSLHFSEPRKPAHHKIIENKKIPALVSAITESTTQFQWDITDALGGLCLYPLYPVQYAFNAVIRMEVKMENLFLSKHFRVCLFFSVKHKDTPHRSDNCHFSKGCYQRRETVQSQVCDRCEPRGSAFFCDNETLIGKQ